jgi:polysaccharide export outer membrane protein
MRLCKNVVLGTLALVLTGCCCGRCRLDTTEETAGREAPREQARISLPTYRVAPPDILLIEDMTNVRTADTRLQAGDQLTVRLLKGLPLEASPDSIRDPLQMAAKRITEVPFKVINGSYMVVSDGTIDFGPAYGKVRVGGLTVPEAKTALTRHLHNQIGLSNPDLSVSLTDQSGKQIVSGEHLVRPDGTVSLGIYGDVEVAGKSLGEIRRTLERHLSHYFEYPQLSVDVLAYNSSVFYIVMDGGGYGEQVLRLPCTGNETVLDAIAQIRGLPQVSSRRIWIARPSGENEDESEVLCVDWDAITACGVARTNYQILPGDRIYVKADCLIATDNFLAKLLSPIERVFGTTLLGTTTAQRIKFFNNTSLAGGL